MYQYVLVPNNYPNQIYQNFIVYLMHYTCAVRTLEDNKI